MPEDATPATETETSEQETPQAPKPTDTVEFWKQKAREQETRAKANADAARKIEEIENASKTETQRVSEALDREKSRADKAEAELLRNLVAYEKGLSPQQAKRLIGSTREELEADADDLLATFKPATEPDPVESVPSLDLGNRGGNAMPLNGDPLEKALRRKLGIT